jgi:GT2 family glycosyltransferase
VVIDNGSTDDSVEKIKTWAAGELSVESKFFAYDPSTKPVRWIEYDRATAEAGGLPELEAEIEALPPNRQMVLIQTGANLGLPKV